MAKGKVILVGAGPWDPGLLTLRGKECLEEAEVILYDDLINPALFKFSPKAKKIYVGKRGGKKSTAQQRINRLLFQFSTQGKRVVRLKGGDPFLFGRGSEEALYLARKKIPFEVVPGVTSAIACLTYAGIPISDREHSSSVGIITGTERPDKETTALDWKKLATGVETLVVLMGVGRLPEIVRHLITNGKSPETPCALIQWGTSPRQKTVAATLKTIVGKSRKILPPAVFVVGNVVGLRRHLNWFETKPLFGKRILVTRPREQVESFARILREKGAEVVALPTSEIVPLGKEKELQKLFLSLPEYDWCFFSSTNGAQLFFSYLEKWGLTPKSLRRVRFAAIGSKTRDSLKNGGLPVSLVPKVFTQEGLISRIREKGIRLEGRKLLLFHAEGARNFLSSSLKKMGGRVTVVTLYASKKSVLSAKPILNRIRKGDIDVVTFTSASCVDHFFSFFPRIAPKKLINGVKVATIGPVTSRRCRDYGLRIFVEARRHTTEGLLEAILARPRNFNSSK